MKKNKEARVLDAQQTLNIIEQGYYEVDNQRIDLREKIEKSIESTSMHTSETLDDLLVKINKEILKNTADAIISVVNQTTMQAAENALGQGRKIACLNFASGKNAGGGFLKGAQAQEESLSRASTLYPTQMKHYDEVYEYNRGRNTFLYSDRMIYSPDVVFFKNDRGDLLNSPYQMDVLTSAAVNIGAMMQNNRTDKLAQAEEVMLRRTDKMLALFAENGADTLILGAWGCGVFRNDPKDIATYFGKYLKSGGKYARAFKEIIFAVYDTSKKGENIQFFKEILE